MTIQVAGFYLLPAAFKDAGLPARRLSCGLAGLPDGRLWAGMPFGLVALG